MHLEAKIEALLKMVVEDEEYDIPEFSFLIYDNVYDGPNNFKVEYYEKYDDRFDTSSCIHLFPFHEEFKSKIKNYIFI